MLVCHSPPDFPQAAPQEAEMVSIKVDQYVGLAVGKQSLLCWKTVMFVMLMFLKHLVCQIVEKIN